MKNSVKFVMLSLLLFPMLASAEIVEGDGTITMTTQEFKQLGEYMNAQGQALNRMTDRSNFFKSKYESAEICVREAVKNGASVLPCFNKVVPNDRYAGKSAYDKNVKEF